MFDDTRRSTALIPFELRSLFYTCISLQSQELATLCMANLHSSCTAECELVLLLSARHMCAQISTQQLCCAINMSPPSNKLNSTQNFACLSSPMHRLWRSQRLYGFTSLEQWNEISYSREGRGPICISGFCCVICLQSCVASVSRLSVDCRRTAVGSTGNNFEEIGRARVDILCHNLRERTVENHGHLNQESRCPGQDSNWALPETGL